MWPKTLLDLIPHLSRLLPMADKFFNSRAAAEPPLTDLAAIVRSDLGRITTANEAVYRKLQDQTAEIALVREDIKALTAGLEEHTGRTTALESALASHSRTLRTVLVVQILQIIAITTLLLWIIVAHVR